MSKLYINTDTIYNIGGGLLNGSERIGEAIKTMGGVATSFRLHGQHGYGVEEVVDDIDAIKNTLRKLKRDLRKLSDAMYFIAKKTTDADFEVWSHFSRLPKAILSGEKIIGSHDYTEDFINKRSAALDTLAIAWSADWIENIKGVAGNALAKISGDAQMWDTLPEKMVRDSLTQYISALTKDPQIIESILGEWKGYVDSEEFSFVMDYTSLALDAGEIITKTNIEKILGKEGKGFTDLTDFVIQQENLTFLKTIKDQLDESLGAMGDTVKYVDLGADFLKKIFTDYSEDIFVLETIKQSLLDCGYNNETVNSVIDQMIWEYRNQYMSAAIDGIEKIADMGIDKVIELAGGNTLTTFIAAKDFGSMISGLDDQADNLSIVYTTQHYSYALVEKYEEYLNKLQSGTYTQSDINQCVMYFNMAVTAKKQEYNAIIKLYEDALNGANGLLASEEDRSAANDRIEELRDEIARLDNMN